MSPLEKAARDKLGNRFGWRSCWITLAGDGTWSFDWKHPDESWEPKRRAQSIDQVFETILLVEGERERREQIAFRRKSRAWFALRPKEAADG